MVTLMSTPLHHAPFSTDHTVVLAHNGLTVCDIQDHFEGDGPTRPGRQEQQRHMAAQEAHKAACRYYAQMLALRQFPAVDA